MALLDQGILVSLQGTRHQRSKGVILLACPSQLPEHGASERFVSGSFSAGVVFLQSHARQEALHHLLSLTRPADVAPASRPVTPAPRSCCSGSFGPPPQPRFRSPLRSARFPSELNLNAPDRTPAHQGHTPSQVPSRLPQPLPNNPLGQLQASAGWVFSFSVGCFPSQKCTCSSNPVRKAEPQTVGVFLFFKREKIKP